MLRGGQARRAPASPQPAPRQHAGKHLPSPIAGTAGGRSFHGAPVRSTHNMPFSTSRGLRPRESFFAQQLQNDRFYFRPSLICQFHAEKLTNLMTFFNVYFEISSSIIILKTLPAFIAVLPLGSVFTAAVFHQIFSSAVPTLYFDILFYND